MCIRDRCHILRYRKGTRGIRIKRIGIVVIIRIGIRCRNLLAALLGYDNSVRLGVRAVLCRYLNCKGRSVAGQLALICLAGSDRCAIYRNSCAGGRRCRNDFNRIRVRCRLEGQILLAGRGRTVGRVLPVYIDAEVRVIPQQVALFALLVYGQVGQICDCLLYTSRCV